MDASGEWREAGVARVAPAEGGAMRRRGVGDRKEEC
jgi:hypothetical protein